MFFFLSASFASVPKRMTYGCCGVFCFLKFSWKSFILHTAWREHLNQLEHDGTCSVMSIGLSLLWIFPSQLRGWWLILGQWNFSTISLSQDQPLSREGKKCSFDVTCVTLHLMTSHQWFFGGHGLPSQLLSLALLLYALFCQVAFQATFQYPQRVVFVRCLNFSFFFFFQCMTCACRADEDAGELWRRMRSDRSQNLLAYQPPL